MSLIDWRFKEMKYIMDGTRFILCEVKTNGKEEQIEWIGNPNIYELCFLVSCDDDMCTIYKHGEKSQVLKQYDDVMKKYLDAGFDDIAKDLKVIDVTNIPLEEINKCLSITGYVSKIVKLLK